MATETQEAIHSYITDMLALEEHIEKALQAQVSAHEEEHATVTAALREMHSTIEGHIAALRALDEGVEGGGGQAKRSSGWARCWQGWELRPLTWSATNGCPRISATT
jgi:ferritin-like metal-binding protein YciE